MNSQSPKQQSSGRILPVMNNVYLQAMERWSILAMENQNVAALQHCSNTFLDKMKTFSKITDYCIKTLIK